MHIDSDGDRDFSFVADVTCWQGFDIVREIVVGRFLLKLNVAERSQVLATMSACSWYDIV